MASWFTGLAGKAEALLERVDQTAADKLRTPQKTSASILAPKLVETPAQTLSAEGAGTSLSGTPHPIQSLPRVSSEGVLSSDRDQILPGSKKTPAREGPTSLSRTKSYSSQIQHKAVTDEQLFEFLNAPNESKPVIGMSDSWPSLKPVKSESNDMDQLADINQESKDVVDGEEEEQMEASVSFLGSVEQGLKEQLSNLELENRLLKREVSSLNQELTNVTDRARQAEKGLSEARKQMESSRRVSSESDRLVKDLQGRHDDLIQTLSARDSQIAVLRVKLQEADEKSSSNQQKIESLRVENERVLQEHSNSHGVQHQVLEELRQKLEETETRLRDEKIALSAAQAENTHQQTQLEGERRQLTETLKETQQRLSEERQRVTEQMQAVKNARADSQSIRKELGEYKEKAQRILQSKDKLINELKTGINSNDVSVSSGAMAVEVEQLRKERDLLREEAHASQLQLDHLRMELQDVEQHHQVEMDEKNERVRELEELLSEERNQRQMAEQEVTRKLQEMEHTQTELMREKTTLQSQLYEKENEVQKLKGQLTSRASVSVSQTELESRIRSLTENLIQKQTIIEALTSEKMSLSMQLERTQSDLTKVQSETTKPQKVNGTTVLQGFDDDSGSESSTVPV
jgi:chromosome segregation ATPase